MKMIFRWFPNGDDRVNLKDIRQIPGVSGVATALSHIPGPSRFAARVNRDMQKQVMVSNGRLIFRISI